MEITLKQTVDAILALCQGERRVFVPSNVRKQIQQLDRDAALEDATLVSAKLQPHFKTLRLLSCIDFAPTTQLRNRPYRVLDRARLQQLSERPDSLVEANLVAVMGAFPPGDDGANAEGEALGEEAGFRPILDALDERSSELRDSIEAELNKISELLTDAEVTNADRFAKLQAQIERTRFDTNQALARIETKLSLLCSLFAPEVLARTSGASGQK